MSATFGDIKKGSKVMLGSVTFDVVSTNNLLVGRGRHRKIAIYMINNELNQKTGRYASIGMKVKKDENGVFIL